MKISSYTSAFQFGHAVTSRLDDVMCYVEEKIDGSQFSAMIDPTTGELYCRSKSTQIDLYNPGMFQLAVDHIRFQQNKLIPGWTYRFEYLQKPKHNVIVYERTPKNTLILFDVDKGIEDYLSPPQKLAHAESLSFECVPCFISAPGKNIWSQLEKLLERESILGKEKIEGVVVKQWEPSIYNQDKKVLTLKFVSQEFKEVHKKEWKKGNPKSKDILQILGEQFKTEARWAKAVQHLRDENRLINEPKDLAILIPELKSDLFKECQEEIKDILFKWAEPHISRKLVSGFPEWYRNYLSINKEE